MQLAWGFQHPRVEQSEWEVTEKQLSAEDKGRSSQSGKCAWLPPPPGPPGTPENDSMPDGAICAPGIVVELLVLISEVQISLGYPVKALRLCKWARHYAREARVDKGAAFADASLLASQIVAECPGLLKIAQLSDEEVQIGWEDPDDAISEAKFPECDAEARWQLITHLRMAALEQAEEQLNGLLSQDEGPLVEGIRSNILRPILRTLKGDLPAEGTGGLNQQGYTETVEGKQSGSEVWLPSALPVLHHITSCQPEEAYVEPPGCSLNCQTYVNLHDSSVERRLLMGLGVAEALQQQIGKEVEYSLLVGWASENLRAIGEPSPNLCVRVWIHQLRGFRMQVEQHLAATRGRLLRASSERVEEQNRAKGLDELVTNQLLGYFQMVIEAAAFVESYCCNDSRLQRELFSEALLLSVHMLTPLAQLLLKSASATEAYSPPLLHSKIASMKKVAIGGTQLCAAAFRQIDRQQHRPAFFNEGAELDTLLDSSNLQKPLIRLFLALHCSDGKVRDADETKGEGIQDTTLQPLSGGQ